jgi:tRNA A-37 threonylcarbamoyl transferase component Bud32
MLIEDPKLLFLHTGWSRSKMLEFLNRNVLAATHFGQEVEAIEIEDMTYTPGRKCIILYSLKLREPPRNLPTWLVVTFARNDRLQKLWESHCEWSTGSSSEPAPAPPVFLSDYQCIVEFFPSDWNLPFLARVTQPKEIAPLLARNSFDGDITPSHRCLEMQVLHYRPHARCVLRYTIASLQETSPTEVIGKVYPQGPKAAQAGRALNTLRLQGAACGVIIPRLLEIMNEGNMLLMERVSGTSMEQVLGETGIQVRATESTRLAAVALSALHGCQLESQEVRSLESELGQVRKHTARLNLVAREVALQADEILNQIEPLALRVGAGPLSVIHGDYKPSQLLMDKDQVAMVDFDRACLGDPAIDVGNFMAQFCKEAVLTGQDHLHRLSTYFLSEYEACSPRKGLVDRARLFQIIALVRMAIRSFRQSPHNYNLKEPYSHPVSLILNEANSCLAEL